MRRKGKSYKLGLAAFVLASLGVMWLAWIRGSPDQPAVKAPDETPAVGAEIRGRVIDGLGWPLPGAVVTAGSASSVADAKGLFAFTDLAAGEYTIEAALKGYGMPGPEGNRRTVVLKQAKGASRPSNVEGIELVMRKLGKLSGRVVSGDAGVSGATLRITWLGEDGQAVRVVPYAIDPAGVSSDGGSFVLDGVAPGNLRLQARAPGHSPVDSTVLVLDDGEHKSGILLDIGGPSQTRVAFTGVFGRVLDERDQAVGDAFVRLRLAGRDELIRTNEQGIFTWQPPPEGDMRGLTAQAGSPRHAPSAAQPVQAGVEAILHVGPGGTVRGRVVDATGAPVKGFLIIIDDARIEVLMIGGTTAFAPQTFTQDDGSFELGPLQPGRFDLRAQTPDFAQGFARDVPVVSGQVTSGIVIALTASAVVRGRVTAARDGLPIERAQVTLFDPTGTLPPRTAMTDAAGEFRVPGVAAGRRSVRIRIEGFLTELVSGIDVPAAGEVVRDVQLRQAEPGESFSFQGIGVTLGQTDRGIVIAQLMDGTPAARAGLQPGDMILTVDRVATAGMRVGQVVDMILGEAGVPVSLEIERNGQWLTVTIERSRVVVKSLR
jgi:hypothetical protein